MAPGQLCSKLLHNLLVGNASAKARIYLRFRSGMAPHLRKISPKMRRQPIDHASSCRNKSSSLKPGFSEWNQKVRTNSSDSNLFEAPGSCAAEIAAPGSRVRIWPQAGPYCSDGSLADAGASPDIWDAFVGKGTRQRRTPYSRLCL